MTRRGQDSDAEKYVEVDRAVFDQVTWTTAHNDLHWGNVTGPELCILDWESWGRAPAGYDASTLLCTSLRHPPTAFKCVYLAIMSLDPTGTGQRRWSNRWEAALNAFEITFDGRLSAARQ